MANGNPFQGREGMTDTQILRQVYEEVRGMREQMDAHSDAIDSLENFRSMIKGVFLGWGLILAPAIAAFVGYTLSQ